MPRIKILSDVQAGQPMPVLLTINGEPTVELSLNTEIDVTDEQFLALSHTDHTIEILIEGETAADEAAQDPAPAGSGDGGDAGGGGDSGGPAAETLPTVATNTADDAELTPQPEGGATAADTSNADASAASDTTASEPTATDAAAGADQSSEQTSTDELELTDQVEQPSEPTAPQADAPAADAPAADAPAGDAPAAATDQTQDTVEQPSETQPAAEPTALDKLEEGIKLEQEALDEMKGEQSQGGDAGTQA